MTNIPKDGSDLQRILLEQVALLIENTDVNDTDGIRENIKLLLEILNSSPVYY